MPRPNYVEFDYYVIRNGKCESKVTSIAPLVPGLTLRDCANRALQAAGVDAKAVTQHAVYRRPASIRTSWSAADFKAWRSRMGLTTRAASEALALTVRSIQLYEKAERPVPGTVIKLCECIEASSTNLLDRGRGGPRKRRPSSVQT